MNFPDLIALIVGNLEKSANLNATLAWSREALDAQLPRLESVVGRLSGTAIAVKDNIVTTDLPTTCASKLLEGYHSPFEATVVSKIKEEGALVACKANLDEFAMGSSTEHSAFGRVLNPLDTSRVPGGSSGGSAALVAAGVVDTALGSETGGSVRQPASFCGVVGIKPSYGRVSRFGLVAFGSSLDCVSTLGKTVESAATLLSVISGQDGRDATTRDGAQLELTQPGVDLDGVVIGVPMEYFPDDLDPGVMAGCQRALDVLTKRGATLKKISLPHTNLAVPTYYVVNPAEAAANLARFDGVRYGNRKTGNAGDIRSLYRATRGEGFGAEVKRRILLGTFVLSAGYSDQYYVKAQHARRKIAGDFIATFDSGVDLLFTPTTPSTAFKAGEKLADPVQMYLSDVFVAPASLAGIPAMSLPLGTSEGLPVGGQLIAPDMAEARMIAVASQLEAGLNADSEVR